ncbi:hypothetical protein NPIL_41681 [Nephila pilipes]|uniref:Uncharacterized protein n=1 Tax=Nephila pilipes TaxID=299642 RepID=A0A8X6UG09_NEPPI|nr:hypothetical protein NPIL_41681 [Nephila pilipes]
MATTRVIKKFANFSRNASANKPRGDPHRNETHFNPRPNSNHGPVCEVEGKMFNESLHELQYENIFINDKIVKPSIDSGANIVYVKSSLIPPQTKSFGTVQLTCAFGNEIQAQLTKIKLALPSFRENLIIVTAAICNKLYCDLIVPPNIFDDLNKAVKENARISEKNPISSHSKKNFLSYKNKNDRKNNFASESVSKNKSSFKNCIYHEVEMQYTIPNHSGDGSRPNDSTQFQNIDNASNEKNPKNKNESLNSPKQKLLFDEKEKKYELTSQPISDQTRYITDFQREANINKS